MNVLGSITVLLVCQLIGETIAKVFTLPVPGPVIGMVLLFLGLVIRRGLPTDLDKTATFLLSQLSLLFIPAGVGVVVHAKLIASEWLPISAALVLGTAITIAVTGLTMTALLKLRKGSRQ
ncbi:CidA/LrgA family protein [Magnetospirillum sulfuroxidans]|uniref:CidA/LrgA family protein n=1 Tax=Magnetospirillum sulfuroxidans TaxID=611300 RepID=A0ABS5IB68_9PROT|nr:CidA/LrgA family protein [Magnetospirillum sulfuroxidans]MBR9971676.1 CidA/LrgA family protein [Magnetospirillum sulfuroxidans]